MQEQILAPIPEEVQVRPIIADVSAKLVDNRVGFDLEWRREGDPNPKTGRIEVGAGDPPTPIHFNLRDNTGLNLAFKSPGTEAMWVDLTGCPPQQAGNGGQIDFNSSSPNLLRVTDANRGPECTLFYMLRFDGHPAANGPPFEFDPEIRNGGGGGI